MKKILIASHGFLAQGVASSIQLLTGITEGITTINAYVNDVDMKDELDNFINSLSKEDEVIAFTDINGGSVNQKVTAEFMKAGIEATIFGGFNLPVILEILLNNKPMTKELADDYIEMSRRELKVSYSQYQSPNVIEDDFFE